MKMITNATANTTTNTTNTTTKMRRRIFVLVAVMMLVSSAFFLHGCAPAIIAGATGGAVTAGGVAIWLTQQPWAAKICYWVGNEGALQMMPMASKNEDADVIAVLADCISYIQKAENIPADQVNAQLAASLQNLPAAQVAYIQEAASVLDEFVPATTSTLPLTSAQLNDIVNFLQGYQDGTRTCMDKLPSQVVKSLAKAQSKRASIRESHSIPMKTDIKKGGWFCPSPKLDADK